MYSIIYNSHKNNKKYVYPCVSVIYIYTISYIQSMKTYITQAFDALVNDWTGYIIYYVI